MKGRTSPLTCPNLLLHVVMTFFLPDKEEHRRYKQPAVPEEKLKFAGASLKPAVETRPHWIISLFEACMVEGVFPARWKQNKLILLRKPNKQPGHPPS